MNKITLILIKNPFDVERERVFQIVDWMPDRSAAAYFQPLFIESEAYHFVRNGEVIPEAAPLQPGDYIAAVPKVAGGGGGGGGKNIASMVAMVALMVVTMGVGNLVAYGTWSSVDMMGVAAGTSGWGLGSYAAAMATQMVGSRLISHWFPPPKPDKPESPTYGWSGVQTQSGQGNAIPIVFGSVRTGGQLLQSHITSDESKQYLNLLLSGGEGCCDYDQEAEFNNKKDEVDRVSGIAEILINNNPLENYRDVQVFKRAGVNNQNIIPGFDNSYIEQSVNQTVTDQGVKVTTTGDNVQRLELILDFPAGIYRINDNGKRKTATVSLKVQYRIHNQTGNNPWLDYYPKDSAEAVVTFSEATQSALKRTIPMEDLPTGQYDLQVTLLSKPDDVMVVWSSVAQVIQDDLVRPNKVLLGLKALATDQLSGGVPTVTWIQTRSKVWVWIPDAANPEGGEYQERDADNPAWACYWLINRMYKLTDLQDDKIVHEVVRGVHHDRIDYQAFKEWADFCDGMQPDGTVLPERKLRVNIILDTAQNLWEALRLIAPLGRGNVFLKGTRYSCICDQPGAPVQLFNMSNMILNSFSEQFSDIKDRANAIEVTFFNKDKDYQRDTVTVYSADYNQATTVQNPTQLTLQGCVTLDQAFRHGQYLLKVNQYNRRTCSWSADVDSIACTIGDVVLVQHDIPSWGNGGRVVAATAKTVRLDKLVSMEPDKPYAIRIRLSNDKIINAAVINYCPPNELQYETDLIEVVTPFNVGEIPVASDLYLFGEVNKVAKPFKILSITKDHLNQRRKITALEYNEAVYEPEEEVPVINYSVPAVTINGVIVSHHIDETGGIWLDLAWDTPRNMYFGAQIVVDNQTERVGPMTNRYSTLVGVAKEYSIGIAALDRFGNPGRMATLSYTATDKPAPQDVTNVQLQENTYVLRDGTVLSDILVTFEPSGEPVRQYNVYYQLDDRGDWSLAGSTPTKSLLIKSLPNTQSIKVKVCTVDRLDNASTGTCSDLYHFTGKSDPPSDVKSITVTQDEYNRSNLILAWPEIDAESNPDLRGYEVRFGDTWEDGRPIGGVIYGLSTTYSITSGNENPQRFWIKSLDNSGNYSVNAALATVSVNLKPNCPATGKMDLDPNDHTNLILTWDAVADKDLACYEVYQGTMISPENFIGQTKETTYRIKLAASGSYNFIIRSRNIAGFTSNTLNIGESVTIEPPNVTGFVLTQQSLDHSKIRFSWQQPNDKDVAYYEIRTGGSWEEGSLIATGISGLFYDAIITEEKAKTYWLKAISNGGNYSQEPAVVTEGFELNPTTPTGLVIMQDPNDKSNLTITWQRIPDQDVNEYVVKVGNDWGTAVEIARTKESQMVWKPAVSGDYKFLLKAINIAGYESDEQSASSYIKLEPANVEQFKLAQNGEQVIAGWEKLAEPDVIGYEIREGAQFENGVLIATGITGTTFAIPVSMETNYSYHIKAINRSGHYSQAADSETITVTNLPPKNVIFSYDEIQLQNGTHANTEFGQNSTNFSNFGVESGKIRFSDYPTIKFNEVGGKVVLKLKAVNGVYPASGTYTCQRKDLGQVLTANVSAQFISSVILSSGISAKLQYRTSTDGVNWAEWKDFVPAKLTFRYLDFRVELKSANPLKTPEVNVFQESIDVPDIDKYGSNVTVAVGGTDILYGHTYWQAPSVSPTAIGSGLRTELVSVSADRFRVKVLNLAGTDVGGKINWIAKGF